MNYINVYVYTEDLKMICVLWIYFKAVRYVIYSLLLRFLICVITGSVVDQKPVRVGWIFHPHISHTQPPCV